MATEKLAAQRQGVSVGSIQFLPTGEGFITGSSVAWGGVFDPTFRLMVTTAGMAHCRVFDIVALRRELRELGLDWPDVELGRGFVGPHAALRKD